MPSTNTPIPSPDQPIPTVGDAIKQISSELYKITGLGISLGLIGKQLPASDLDPEQFCPEMVIPVLAADLVARADACFSAIESLEYLLKNTAGENKHG